MKRPYLFTFFLLFLTTLVFAQTDSLSIDGSIGLRGKYQTGNLTQFVINPNGKLILEKQLFQMELGANYEFLKVTGHEIINDLWTYGIYQHRPYKTIFPMAITYYGFAKSYRIDQSLINGLGIGFNLIKRQARKYIQANIFTGYLSFKYKENPAHESMNLGSFVKMNLPIRNTLSISAELHTYLSLDDTDFRGLNNRITFHIQAFKRISINLSHNIIHNNVSAEFIKRTNSQLLFGVNYLFI